MRETPSTWLPFQFSLPATYKGQKIRLKTESAFEIRPEREGAKEIQGKLLRKIPKANPTDPLLTHSGQKRAFPGRKVFRAKRKALD